MPFLLPNQQHQSTEVTVIMYFVGFCLLATLKLFSLFPAALALLQATSRVPRWWIGERPPDMVASCDIYK